MLALIKKDFKLNFAVKSSLISLVLLVPFMVFIMEINNIDRIYPFVILSFGYILTNIPFKYEAREKPHLLMQSLPSWGSQNSWICITNNLHLHCSFLSIFRLNVHELQRI